MEFIIIFAVFQVYISSLALLKQFYIVANFYIVVNIFTLLTFFTVFQVYISSLALLKMSILTVFQVYISSLALLKMLKHGRAGVPMEVMGLMLGEFVDEYMVTVVDVFAMPQSGTVSFVINKQNNKYKIFKNVNL